MSQPNEVSTTGSPNERWIAYLDGSPAGLDVPADSPRWEGVSTVVESISTTPTEAVRLAVARLVETVDLPPDIVILGAWAALVSLYSGQDDVLIGRADGLSPQAEILRIAQPLDRTFRALCSLTAEADATARSFGPIDVFQVLETMRTEPGDDRHPLFQVGFVVVDEDNSEDLLWTDEYAPCDLVFGLVNSPSTDSVVTRFALQYRRDRYTLEHAERILGHLQVLLLSAASSVDEGVQTLRLLTDDERLQFDQWNATEVARDPDLTVAALFDAQAERTPEAIALEFDQQTLTYAELNARSSDLATALRDMGVGPDVRVGICVGRSFAMVTAVLAVLKAGGTYVPIDPEYPENRRTLMLEDARVRLVINGPDLEQHHHLALVMLETTSPIEAESDLSGDLSFGGRLGYVVFTSGSTGRPKAVALPQRALTNLLEWQLSQPGFAVGARTLQFTSLSFDVSFQEIFSTLCSGGTLVMVTDAERGDPLTLLHRLTELGVQRLFLPFVALRGLASAMQSSGLVPSALREIYTAGEQLTVDDAVRAFFAAVPDCFLENQYGPSESHVVSWYRLSGDSRSWETLPPIGVAVANSRLYVLGNGAEECPVGVAGELFIGGMCLARGYLGRPDFTNERFVSKVMERGAVERLYRTGDLVRRRADGNIEFLGRGDNQVKFRGYRVELGEVSAALSNHSEVAQCVATLRPIDSAGMRLVAFLVPADSETQIDLRSVHRFAQDNLAPYLVPSHYGVVSAFPLTPSGKIDVESLPMPVFNRQILDAVFKAPTSSEEIRLAVILSTLLGVDRIGVHDDFFVLGGDSLMAVELFAKIRAEFGRDLPLGALASSPTIAGLVGQLAGRGDDWPILIPMQTAGTRIPVFCVHGGTGNVATFPLLARALGEDQPFYALQWDGLDGSRGSRTIEAMAVRYLIEVRTIQPHGPYLLAGQCVGGLVALEMARSLVGSGESVASLTMFDAPNLASTLYRPDKFLTSAKRAARSFAPRRQFGEFRTMVRREAESYRGGVRPAWREEHAGAAMVSAAKAYRPAPLDVPTLYFSSGENDAYKIKLTGRWTDGLMGWSPYRSACFEINQVSGGHNHLLYADGATRVLRKKLDEIAAIPPTHGNPVHETPGPKAMNDPMFSILIAPFCRAEQLHDAIESVLNQTDRDFEIIVSDNWSADDSESTVQSFNDARITFTRPAKHGLAADALEHARTLARGRYLIVLRAIDGLLPSALATYRQSLETSKAKVLFSSHADYYDHRYVGPSSTSPKPNTLIFSPGSDRELAVSARAYLTPMFALAPYFHEHISCYVIERALSIEVARSFGSLFFGFEFEHFTLPAAIITAESAVFLDRPLVVVRYTANPPHEQSTDGLSIEEVWQIHHGWEADLIISPVKSHAQSVTLIEGLWGAQSSPGGAALMRFGRDFEGFAETLRKELLYRKGVGLDVEADIEALNRWCAMLPAKPDRLVIRNRREAAMWRRIHHARRARNYRKAQVFNGESSHFADLAEAIRFAEHLLEARLKK